MAGKSLPTAGTSLANGLNSSLCNWLKNIVTGAVALAPDNRMVLPAAEKKLNIKTSIQSTSPTLHKTFFPPLPPVVLVNPGRSQLTACDYSITPRFKALFIILFMRNGSSRSPPQTLPFSVPPYLLSIEDGARQLDTDPESGLPDSECHSRQQQYGPNAVSPPQKNTL